MFTVENNAKNTLIAMAYLFRVFVVELGTLKIKHN